MKMYLTDELLSIFLVYVNLSAHKSATAMLVTTNCVNTRLSREKKTYVLNSMFDAGSELNAHRNAAEASNR